MTKFKKVTSDALHALITAMYKADCSGKNLYEAHTLRKLRRMLSLARSHNKLAEAGCNGELTKAQVTKQGQIELELSEYAREFSLRAQFTGDPRGFTVKLHTESQNMYNTMGGSESGYGI